MDEEKSILEVENKREDYDYYWASNSPRSSQYYRRKEREGYEVVRSGDNEAAPFADMRDGAYQIEDLILMRISKERNLRRRKNIENRLRGIVEENERSMEMLGTSTEGVENMSVTHTEQEEDSGKSFYFPENPIAKGGKKKEVKKNVEAAT